MQGYNYRKDHIIGNKALGPTFLAAKCNWVDILLLAHWTVLCWATDMSLLFFSFHSNYYNLHDFADPPPLTLIPLLRISGDYLPSTVSWHNLLEKLGCFFLNNWFPCRKCTDQLWVSDDYEGNIWSFTVAPYWSSEWYMYKNIYIYGVSKIITSYSFP